MRLKSIILAIITFAILNICSPVLAFEISSLRPEVPEDKIYCTVEEEQEYADFIASRIDALKEAGMDPNIFENLKIEIHPAYLISFQYFPEDTETYYANGLTRGRDAIVLSMGASENTLFHELGHVIEGKKLNVRGYNWTYANEIGQPYIKLKKHDKELTDEAQLKLPWEERLSEWFAEDVKHFIQEHVLKYQKTSDNWSGIPERTEEVDSFLEQLIFE